MFFFWLYSGKELLSLLLTAYAIKPYQNYVIQIIGKIFALHCVSLEPINWRRKFQRGNYRNHRPMGVSFRSRPPVWVLLVNSSFLRLLTSVVSYYLPFLFAESTALVQSQMACDCLETNRLSTPFLVQKVRESSGCCVPIANAVVSCSPASS